MNELDNSPSGIPNDRINQIRTHHLDSMRQRYFRNKTTTLESVKNRPTLKFYDISLFSSASSACPNVIWPTFPQSSSTARHPRGTDSGLSSPSARHTSWRDQFITPVLGRRNPFFFFFFRVRPNDIAFRSTGHFASPKQPAPWVLFATFQQDLLGETSSLHSEIGF